MEAITGGLFHDPSSGIASRVFPKFHPGFRAANAADAVTGVNVPVQDDEAVAETELDELFDVDEDFDVEEDFEEVVVLVERVVATELDLLVELVALLVTLELAVPGTH